MNVYASHAERSQSWSCRALGLIAVVWLNLALQPCAMAFEQDHDCPHCPPAEEQAMAGHHGHSDHKAEAPCASMQAQCGDLADVSLDGRAGKLKIKDITEMPVAIAACIAELPNHLSSHSYSATDPPYLHSASPPLRDLYCVYLK